MQFASFVSRTVFGVIAHVIQREKSLLLFVGALIIGYILIRALVIFNVESGTFNTFFDAIYWACVSLTTVGYGDIYPVSDIGRVVTMVPSLVSVALIVLPSGILTSGYMNEMRCEISTNDTLE